MRFNFFGKYEIITQVGEIGKLIVLEQVVTISLKFA